MHTTASLARWIFSSYQTCGESRLGTANPETASGMLAIGDAVTSPQRMLRSADREPLRLKMGAGSATMSVKMPEADAGVFARRDEIVRALRSIVAGEGVIATEREMRPYESDGLTAYRQLPMVVVLPSTSEPTLGTGKWSAGPYRSIAPASP